jgi:hypothetical protein
MTINYNEFNDNNDLMDALLDKVSMDGFDKLSEQEKDLLNKISNGDEIEFSQGFTDLHTKSYMEILKGNGFGLEEARKSIEIVHKIRNSTPIGLKGDYHPLCK